MEFKITQKQLEKLKEASKDNEEGISNFKLIENKDNGVHYIFKVVCERLLTTNKIIEELTQKKELKE